MNIIETNLSFGSMTTRSKTERIILHHSAGSSCTAEQIHQWHLNNGWAGAGYHFLVRKDGSIYRLRPEDKVGAHASGSNFNSIGICAEGNFQEESMCDAQKNSLKELVSYLKGKYNITKVQRHSDVNNTACPGKNYPFDEIANAQSSTQSSAGNSIENTGNDTIKSIQTTLNNRYGFNLVVDGIYGTETHKAMVKALQIEFNKQLGAGLTVDGIFGSASKSKCPVLKIGVSGNITWLVQAMLVIKGYNIGSSGIDSKYGNGTASGVYQYQIDNGLTADRKCGKNTFEKLFK